MMVYTALKIYPKLVWKKHIGYNIKKISMD